MAKTLDWGPVTPEAANIEKNEFIYIYNHELSNAEKIDRTIRFVIGRLKHYDTELPKDAKHIITIDTRGQNLPDFTCKEIEVILHSLYQHPERLTIHIINK